MKIVFPILMKLVVVSLGSLLQVESVVSIVAIVSGLGVCLMLHYKALKDKLLRRYTNL